MTGRSRWAVGGYCNIQCGQFGYDGGLQWRPLFSYAVGEVAAIVTVVQKQMGHWLLKVIYCPYLEKHDFTKRHPEYRLVVPVELILARARA